MNRREPAALDTKPVAGAVVFVVGSTIVSLLLVLKISAPGAFEAETAFHLVFDLAFVLLGAVTVWKRPDNRTSWLLAWVAITLGLSLLTDEYGTPGGGLTRSAEGVQTVATWFSSWLWVPAFGPLFTLLLLWFPTGRPPSSRWKSVERAAVVLIAGLALLLAFSQDPESSGVNPLAVPWLTSLAEKVFVVLGPTFPALVALCAVSLVVRFRRARGDEAQQLKWFVVAAFVMVLYMTADTIALSMGADPPWLWVLEVVAFLGLPTAAGIAILKYRLYDIDVVINRALVYAGLTAILAAAYVGLVFVLQVVLSSVTAESDLAIAASTLAVAALFRPVRTRVQAFIDRRFYRKKFDVEQTLSDFGNHLRDEVDLDSLTLRLQHIVRETMQPAHVSLWMRRAEP